MTKTALISVSDKTGITEFAQQLEAAGVKILSTGGTAKTLSDAGIKITQVAEHTGAPEIMDGRVKTLHPKIHGGILALRDNDEHQAALAEHKIETIDLLVVNLYPFEETLKSGADSKTIIENIDIGGPSMVRSAAKNHFSVTILTDIEDYDMVLQEIKNNGETSLQTRKKLAQKAFALTSYYDAKISAWMAGEFDVTTPAKISFAGNLKQELRYGENPHQSAALYVSDDSVSGVVNATQLQGKELSYNNINDTDAAYRLVQEFDAPAIAIIKHANPCGVATASDLATAYSRAYSCDTVSAFGGIIAANKEIDEICAQEITKIFAEVIIAPSISNEAKKIFAAKKNLRVLVAGVNKNQNKTEFKSVSGGLLVQDNDLGEVKKSDLKTITKTAPTGEQIEDMLLAFKICKHVKSNAIVFVKDGATIGIGAGQMSRVDSVKCAAAKAKEMGLDTQACVMASDAFFPFRDNVDLAAEFGVAAIIQPGGSVRDEEVTQAANEHGIAMALTGMRHFKH